MQEDNYKLFLGKMKLWQTCVDIGDSHSVLCQLLDLLENYRVFDVICKMRELSPRNEKGDKKINPMIHSFINRCFRTDILMRIRRLRDSSSYAIENKEKGTYSLTHLLKDMRNNNHLLTRENYLRFHGFDYSNPAILKVKMWDDVSVFCVDSREGNRDIVLDCINSNFDELAEVAFEDRSFGDCVSKEVFKKFLKKFSEVTHKLKIYADKYLAHAATRENLKNSKAEKISFTLVDIENAIKEVCQTVHYILLKLLAFVDNDFIVYHQFNHFQYIEEPLIAKDNLPKLYEFWHRMDDEIKSWTHEQSEIENYFYSSGD